MSVKLGKTLDDLTNQVCRSKFHGTKKYFECSEKYITIKSNVILCPVCNKHHGVLGKMKSSFILNDSYVEPIEIYDTEILENIPDNNKKYMNISIGKILDLEQLKIHERQEFKRWVLRKEDGTTIIRLKLNTEILILKYRYRFEEGHNGEYTKYYESEYLLKLDNIGYYGDIILINENDGKKKEINHRLYGTKLYIRKEKYTTGETYYSGDHYRKEFELYDEYLTNGGDLYIEYEDTNNIRDSLS
jgi:hypothetical protein